jgi:hypothetical protein
MRRVADPQATPVGNLPVRPGLAGFKSERWPASFRNGGRHQIGMPGRNASEFAIFWTLPLLRLVPYLNETLQFPPSAFFGFSLCRE